MKKKLEIVPIFQKDAFAFVQNHHRHHIAPVGSVFQIALSDGENVVGVAIVGRPNARRLQDGLTLEVTRLCVLHGLQNGCSMLYARCWQAAKALGYKRLITYILKSEPGISLKAAGWQLIGERGGGTWSVPSRPRADKHPLETKILFQMTA